MQEYLGLPRLQAYVICAQDAARVWLWARGNQGWPAEPEIIESADANVEIAALSLSIPMREIFRGVSL